MAPAQVPNSAPPCSANFSRAWASPSFCKNLSCVVLSPPGRTKACRPSRSATRLTSRAETPRLSSILRCASKSPWTASMPTVIDAPKARQNEERGHGSGRAPTSDPLPAARLEQLLFVELANVNAAHGFAQLFGGFEDGLCVLVMGGGFYDGAGANVGVGGFEDAGADENGFGAELHDQGSVRGGGYAAGGEIRDGQLAVPGHVLDEIERGAEGLGFVHELLLAQCGEATHVVDDGAHVAHGFHDVAGAGLALGAHHGGAFADAAEGFAQIAGAADERDFEAVFPDVVLFIGGGEDFAFVYEIHFEGFEHLRLGKMADADFGHHGNGYRGHDFADDLGGGHAGDAAFLANVGRDALERHDGARSGLLCNLGLLGGGDVHDDAALEHFREAYFYPPGVVIEQAHCPFSLELTGSNPPPRRSFCTSTATNLPLARASTLPSAPRISPT